MDELKKLRNHLDLCDEMIVDALRMRYEIVEELTRYKKEHEMSIVQPEEEARKRAFVKEKVEDYSYQKSIMKIFEEILYRSKRVQSHQVFNCNIFLIGFMGAGKSTVSAALNDLFAMDVIEMDQIISERNGMSISEIFSIHGEEYFRSQETELLIEIQSAKNKIISCGGGVPMRPVNVQEMKKSGKVVLLTAKPDTILERVRDNHDRPLLENNKTVEHISSLMEQRRPKYEAAADIIIETDGKTAFQICEEIIARVHEIDTQA